MSTNLEINPELPLNQFKKELPKKKYNDILKLRLLEAEFDNTMDQYQRTYQTYLVIQNSRFNMNGVIDIQSKYLI